MSRNHRNKLLLVSLLLFISFLPLSTPARSFFLTAEDLEYDTSLDDQDLSSTGWDESGYSQGKLDPGSWRPIFEPDPLSSTVNTNLEDEYYSCVRKMVSAVSSGDTELMEEAASEIEAAAAKGDPHAQSVLGFLFGTGQLRNKSEAKAFLYHQFASQGGNMQSKMALAYTYYRQNMHEEAAKLYMELAEVALSSMLISKDPGIEQIRIHSGTEESKAVLRKYRGENDEEFQVTEYQAQKGDAESMYTMGAYYYYFGLRGVRRDYAKALSWLLKAAEKGDPRAMELLGEIYARGDGVERNYTKAFKWLTFASKRQHFSAYNGMGYLYAKGYAVEKNDTKAREYFEKAAEKDVASAHYNLGVLYLKGIGVKKNVKTARQYFINAANVGQPKAIFQLAKMFHTGIGLKKNLDMAAELYKSVAERGPWSSSLRWALESYLKGEVGKAFLLYLRMAELGYEIAQSNAAWILDKYGKHCMCMGGSGFCTDTEMHQRAHALWWQASEQGNVHAALLIGDAYYYGRGTESDYERAAEAYMHARSQSNAQAMFNLGYMYEHGHGLPFDLHLAKRFYDQALLIDPAAKLPVTLALMSLWIRKNYANGFLVNLIDSLPELQKKVEAWVGNVVLDEGNATILALFVCLLTVLYFRRQRRHAAAADIAPGPQPRDRDILAPN